jgi:hypothetical protein
MTMATVRCGIYWRSVCNRRSVEHRHNVFYEQPLLGFLSTELQWGKMGQEINQILWQIILELWLTQLELIHNIDKEAREHCFEFKERLMAKEQQQWFMDNKDDFL